MKKPNLVVIGSLNMDILVEAPTFPRIGETILGQKAQFLPGGKGANQAVAAARLGADSTLIGAVGTDVFGPELLSSLERNGVQRDAVKQVPHTATGIASILLAEGDNCIVVVPGANHQLRPEDVDRYEQVLHSADMILLQLEIPMDTVEYAIQKASSFGKPILLNPAPAQPLPDDLYPLIDYLTPNRTELAVLTGVDEVGADLGSLEAAMSVLRSKGVRNVVTTLGADGSAFLTKDGEFGKLPGHKVPVVDTVGAGDSYNAGLAYALASGFALKDAVVFASRVSALAVTKFGAQEGMPTLQELQQFSRSLEGGTS
ncbi:ribokinase [Paenibacillus allorhizosphaerae]|uniref:Ribokinase n=1 Tax=Paenibacillus allorhizosphaerae TaxID=2849866 RepID=A0ABN7TWE5_9BACL|nr:ribokinase [Paenibacillus allorhizosphaerae]CAG7654874.1 Ribokinase [Paenibacillus allorhizosphaerae]